MTLKRARLTITAGIISAMMFALMPASPASATHAIGVVGGIATLNPGLPSASGTFTFSGVANGSINGNLAVGATTTASGTYANPDSVTGTASGTITVAGAGSSSLSWNRIGVIATVEAYGSTWAAVFVPLGYDGVGLNQAAVVAVGGVDL